MKSVITISREMGSGGDVVGYEVARRLGFTCVNRSFVDIIARKARVTSWQVQRAERLASPEGPRSGRAADQNYDEREGRSLDALIRRLGYGESLGGREYLANLRAVMDDLASIGQVVIIGRGGQVILREHPDAFHVRILAQRAARVAEVQATAGVSPGRADETVALIDGLRDELLRELGCEDIDDPALYDLVLHSDGRSTEDCVQQILLAIEAASHESLFEPTIGRLEE